MFDTLRFLPPDRLVIENLEFRLEPHKVQSSGESNQIPLYKWEEAIEKYKIFFSSQPLFRPKHILELGVWEGGSLIFWNKLLKPDKIVGVDRVNNLNLEIFQPFQQSDKDFDRNVKFVEADQSDETRLKAIVASEFNDSIDLVIDDCSHMYLPTKASFEILFPHVASGGWYIVEDWAWGHVPGFVTSDHPFAEEEPLTKFVFEVVELLGSNKTIISQLIINRYFIAAQKGSYSFESLKKIKLSDYIYRHIPFFKRSEGGRVHNLIGLLRKAFK